LPELLVAIVGKIPSLLIVASHHSQTQLDHMLYGTMSGPRHTGCKRSVCNDSYAAEDNFAYIRNDNRKCGRAVNRYHIGVADMEPFSYARLAHQHIYVAASSPFTCLRSSPAMDVEKLERKSERGLPNNKTVV